jgi:Protein of unknown function (DUF1499).
MTPPTTEAPRARGGGRLRRVLLSVVLPALLGAGIVGALLFVPPAGWTTNDVTTGKHPGYPDLTPHLYDATVSDATRFAAAAATRLRWKVIETNPESGTMRAEVTAPIPVFRDDLTVTVTPRGNAALVSIHSRSRTGFGGDLGANARHIRALQAAMDAKLPLASPAP